MPGWSDNPRNYYELGFDGEQTSKNEGIRYQFIYPTVRELAQEYHNPPVELGKGAGPMGEDSTFTSTPYTMRVIPGQTLKDFRLNQYYNNPQVQHILKNYDISKEHPGLGYQPGLYASHTTGFGPMGFGSGIFRSLGWSYYDSPDGEGCHEKMLAMVKLGFAGSIFVFLTYQAYSSGIRDINLASGRQMLARYPRYLYAPTVCGATFAAVSCVSCRLRGKDDIWNYALGGMAMGIPVYARYNAVVGFMTAVYGGIVASSWKAFMHTHRGIMGGETTAELWGSAQSWRWEWLPFFKYRKHDDQERAIRMHYGHDVIANPE